MDEAPYKQYREKEWCLLHGGKSAAIWVLRRHAHSGSVDWWWRSGAVRGAGGARVVLRAAPAKTNTRVADRVTLHLVDGHLGRVTLHELDETASLAGRNLHIRNLTESLEEGSELVLGDVSREATDKDSGVVGIRELVHRLGSTIVAHWGSTHRVHAHAWTTALLRHAHTTGSAGSTALVLGGSSGNAHRAVAAVDALHLGECLLLVFLAGESDETITAGHAADWVGHDLCRLSGRVAVLEELYEDEFSHFWAKVTDEDGEFGATLVTAAIGETTTRSPIKLERAVRVGNKLTIERQGLGSGISAREINEAISSIAAGEFVADHLYVDGLAHVVPDAADEVLINPWLEFTHPESGLASTLALALTIGTGTLGTHVALRRKAIARCVHLLTEIRLRGLVVLLARRLTLELIVVLERHDENVDRDVVIGLSGRGGG
jgi:hypothetical protein